MMEWQRVIPNRRGRIIFLVFTLADLLLVGLIGLGIMWAPEGSRWLPGTAIIMGILAMSLLLSIAFSGMMYSLRFANVAFLAIMGAVALVIEGMLLGAEDISVLLVGSVGILTLHLFAMALVLFPDSHSDIAHRLHPFVAEHELGDITLTGVAAIKRGRKRIKHREVSIFEDWPAPVPFPAKALYTYRTGVSSELPFSRGDQLTILDCRGNWWQAKHPISGGVGFVPSNYIKVLQQASVKKSFEAKSQDEVTIIQGQTVEVMEVHEFMCLVRSVDGKIGSVPTDSLEVDPTPLSTMSASSVLSGSLTNNTSPNE